MISELYGLLFHAKYVINPYLDNIDVFPYVSRATGINFSRVLEVLLICDSKYLKTKILEYLYFPILSRIIGINFSHVLGIVWISARNP